MYVELHTLALPVALRVRLAHTASASGTREVTNFKFKFRVNLKRKTVPHWQPGSATGSDWHWQYPLAVHSIKLRLSATGGSEESESESESPRAAASGPGGPTGGGPGAACGTGTSDLDKCDIAEL